MQLLSGYEQIWLIQARIQLIQLTGLLCENIVGIVTGNGMIAPSFLIQIGLKVNHRMKTTKTVYKPMSFHPIHVREN